MLYFKSCWYSTRCKKQSSSEDSTLDLLETSYSGVIGIFTGHLLLPSSPNNVAVAMLWECSKRRLGVVADAFVEPIQLASLQSLYPMRAHLFDLIRFAQSQPLASHVPVSVRTPHTSALTPEYLVEQTLYVFHRLAKYRAATKALDQLG